jgi:hypothetical protein
MDLPPLVEECPTRDRLVANYTRTLTACTQTIFELLQKHSLDETSVQCARLCEANSAAREALRQHELATGAA